MTLNLEEPDRVPLFDFLYESGSFENVLGRKIEVVTPEIIVEGYKALGVDLMAVGYDPPEDWKAKRSSSDIVFDEWGVKYKAVEYMRVLPWYIEGPIKNEEDIKTYTSPDPEAPGRFRTLNRTLELVGDEIAVSLSVSGPFTIAWMLMGPKLIFKTLISQPSTYHRILDIITEFLARIIEICLKEQEVNLIFLAEDLGDIHGPYCSPLLFRDRILPYLKRIIWEVKAHGGYLLLHSDGNINLILGDLVEAGIDAYHPIERKAGMNIGDVKRHYGDKICLIGNVDASTLLPFGSLQEISEQIDECMRIAAPGGGYIFSSDHSIHPGIPGEKAIFMFKVAKRKGIYPLR